MVSLAIKNKFKFSNMACKIAGDRIIPPRRSPHLHQHLHTQVPVHTHMYSHTLSRCTCKHPQMHKHAHTVHVRTQTHAAQHTGRCPQKSISFVTSQANMGENSPAHFRVVSMLHLQVFDLQMMCTFVFPVPVV